MSRDGERDVCSWTRRSWHPYPGLRDRRVVTDDVLTFAQAMEDRTGLGLAWLLVLAGPLGWLGLVVIAATRHGDGR